MLSIIGAVLGLVGSFLPELLKYFKQKEDHKHEKEMFALQVQLAEKQHEFRVDEMNITADIEETKAMYKSAEVKLTGSKWLDAVITLYNSSVRPTITYAFVIFYGLVKLGQYKILLASGYASWEVVTRMWSGEDMACFMTVIGFWFGGRMVKAMVQRYGNTR
jgi:hypothetical protein